MRHLASHTTEKKHFDVHTTLQTAPMVKRKLAMGQPSKLKNLK